MYGTVSSASSSSKATSVMAVCGCAAVFAVAGFVAAQPRSLYAPVAVRPAVQASMTAAPMARVVRPSFASAAIVEAQAAEVEGNVFSKIGSTFAPLALGVGALTAFVAAFLHKQQSVAMAATSGERLLWIPNATAPAHLTGEFPGDRGFDPLGLAKDPKVYARMRISEVFHGRLAMLGIVGCIVPDLLFGEGAWFDYSNFDLPRIGLIAMQVIAPLEYWRGNGGLSWDGLDGPDRSYPGFDPLGLTNDETKLQEIKNGRLAMTAMLGLEVQSHVTGKSPVANLHDHLLHPLTANILTGGGSVAMFSTAGAKTGRPLWFPGGYAPKWLDGKYPGDRGFDPAGLAADPKVYERMRISEVYHGRLAMLAMVGAVVPDFLGKGVWWTNAQSLGIGVQEVAIFTAAYGLAEVARGLKANSDITTIYPGFDPLNLTTDYTKEAEIKNGRLALTGLLGLEVQRHVTGVSPLVNLVEHVKHPLNHNIAESVMHQWPVAMFAATGHKDGLWFPGAKAPAHLTGEYPADRGFDPLSLAADPTVFARMRVSEVYHARLSMLAIVGAILPELLGKGAWFEAGNDIDGIKLGFIGMLIAAPSEYWRGQGGFGWDKSTTVDRSYPGFDPLKLTTDYTKAAEIKNGRLAMTALLGLTFQYLATGESPMANVAAHLANPVGANITTTLA